MYVKLFGSILHSSIWSTDLATRVVWITMLAMADEYGIVHAAVSGLAREANVSDKDCRRALRVLASPDKESRSPEAQGRRIAAIPGGWRLINYQKYREIRTQRQFADAERQARHREAQRDMSRDTVTRHGDHTPVTDITTEAEAEAEAETEREAALRARLPPAYHDVYDGYRRAAQHPDALTAAILAEGPDTGTNGTPGKTWEVIGQALLEMRAAGKPFTPALLRAFVRKLLEAPSGGAMETPGDRARRRADELERAAQGGAP